MCILDIQEDKVMVILNKNETAKGLDFSRFEDD